MYENLSSRRNNDMIKCTFVCLKKSVHLIASSDADWVDSAIGCTRSTGYLLGVYKSHAKI